MRTSSARELFRQLTKSYFAGATVTMGRQSRVPKPDIPLITITPGNTKRTSSPCYKVIDGELVGHYASRILLTIDLFTHGAPVADEDGTIVAYENTAMDDLLAFADFLGSQYAIEWCNSHDVSISIEGEVQDLTAVVNDNNYEYRSRMMVGFYFTQRTVGYAAVLSEESVLYPTGEKDTTGNPIYTPQEPVTTTSTTGTYPGITEPTEDEAPIISPELVITPSGGGTEELAEQVTGYFTEVEMKEETGNE